MKQQKRTLIISYLSLVLMIILTFISQAQPLVGDYLSLRDGWTLQSSEKVTAKGEVISTPAFNPAQWYPTSVPTTVLEALVQNGVYTNIWFGKKFDEIPKEQFKKSWWFRKEFQISQQTNHNIVKLEFDGIIYRANIFLNGTKIGSSDTIEGVYRQFEFDVTSVVKKGGINVLAVEVIPPVKGEPSVGFVDWNPRPPDANMGIWREVKLKIVGNISLNYPCVRSTINTSTLKEADLSITVEAQNNTTKSMTGILEGQIEGIQFSKQLALAPLEKKIVAFVASEFPQLHIVNPRLWWTHDVGNPELYNLKLQFKINDAVSDQRSVRFGIREVKDYINSAGHRGYMLNGKKLLIRGGGWADDLLLEFSYDRIQAQVKYTKHMNLNTIRCEGLWGNTDDFFNICDEEGIFLMYGYSCQWEWEEYLGKPTDEMYGGILSPEDIKLVTQMWKDNILWLRNHPSIYVWAYASDLIPKPGLEQNYLTILKEYDPTRPSLASTHEWTSSITGPTAVKMRGPYEYVPPMYWYADTSKGGAFGFNTETGPGAQVPPLESVKRMIPADHLWPQDDYWNYHCCRNEFGSLRRYNLALNSRFGPSSNVEEYCRKAQYHNYEGMRAMYEAFTSLKYTSTGVIQWMLNSSWPKLFWQLYDYYLMPTGALYGAKQACRPNNIQYNYANKNISVVNNTFEESDGLTAKIQVLNFDLIEKYASSSTVTLLPDQALVVGTIPVISGLTKTYFVDLRLFDKTGKEISANLYVLSTQPDVLISDDSSKASWFVTPQKQYADLTALNNLGKVSLKTDSRFISSGKEGNMTVTIENPGEVLAFCIEVIVRKGTSGEAILPIFLDDNYFSLMPGEKRTVTARFDLKLLQEKEPSVEIQGWNTLQ